MSNITNEELDRLLTIAQENTEAVRDEVSNRSYVRQSLADTYTTELAFIEELRQRVDLMPDTSKKADLTTNRTPGTTSHGELMRMQDEGEQ